MSNLLLSHRKQQGLGYCLPACVQMVLDYLGISRSQKTLGQDLGLISGAGVPYSRIKRLASSKIKVTLAEGTVTAITNWLNQNVPVIVFVNADELPHWRTSDFAHQIVIQHTVVVVGLDDQTVYLMDPALNAGPTFIDKEAFMLAWSWMDYYYTVLTRR